MFCDSNGLVAGRIPAGTPCPFYKECNLCSANCPTEDETFPYDFSCAFARGFSLTKETK
jgi:hypothetical protein